MALEVTHLADDRAVIFLTALARQTDQSGDGTH
jgi:hypothetical protein